MGKEKTAYVLQKNSANGQLSVTIPSRIASFKGWKKGTELDFKESMGQIYVVEVHGMKTSYAIQERNNGNLSITISSKIAAFKGWKGGTKIEFKESMGNIYLAEVQ